ncbi:MAG: DsbA family protein [Trebonia sp.]|uniref:hypothetical protein n=1 Tax=Trebonia sp. TaxID=2767075 RepID=UPI003C73C2F0
MAVDATPDDRELTLPPLDEKVDHVRGSATGRLILEYGDYECPYSRQAFHAISQVEQQLGGNMRFACLARRPCSSTASSTAAATTRPPC